MRTWKRILMIMVATVVLIAVVALASGVALTDFLVNYWWHDELGFGGYFWLKLLYKYILSGTVTLLFFLVFFLNFWAASRYLGVDENSFEGLGRLESSRYRGVLRMLRTGSMRAYTPLSLILAVLIAVPFYKQWEAALLFVFAPLSGSVDPVFGNDVSFYLFSYPVFELVQFELLTASILATLAIGILYLMEHRLLPEARKIWPTGAKVHMAILAIITTLIIAWGFMLNRFNLLYTDAHEPVFFGPGFVEIRYFLPLIWISIAALIVMALSGLNYLNRRRGLVVSIGAAVLLMVAVGLRYVGAIPDAITRFVVRPNPVATEREFMKNNIEATLAAYDLRDIKTIDVSPGLPDEDVLDPELRGHLYNIPVWDPEFLDDVYQQLQGIRPYYRFSDVDVARYLINGRLEQVNLSAREVNIAALPPAAKNWENTHLRYTHGFGAVVTPAAQDGQTPMRWFLKDLNLQTDVGLKIDKPDIYFGEADLPYAIAPNKLNVVGVTSADEESSFNYSGRGGVPISSLFRRLLFSLYFRDEKLFFSVNVGEQSRALFHRNIVQRVKNLTPFLELDHDPYIVITPQRAFWIMDAYTTSNWYPVSIRSKMRFNRGEADREFNYIRNSVKIVVDAFDGTVDYYVADPADPILQGYRKAFPSLFKDLTSMPPALQEQLRHPRDMFTTQMRVFARYHQTAPELFYEQAETWEFPKVNDSVMKPFYFTTSLEGYRSDRPSFVMIHPMTPVGRSNLSVLAVAGTPTMGANVTPGQKYGKQIVLYRFSRDTQVEGPGQVSALIDQDPEISQQFALWDQKGSHVLRGRIIVIPVGRSVLYVQPVYIVSTGNTRIPELQRIILSMGNVVVMDASLEQGVLQLEQKLKNLRARSSENGSLRPAATPAASAGPM